ncbi:alpha/beta hydrolase [Vibrio parahaemolyticus]|nr:MULTISPECIES: alpha/beta hydrolase [Vibrio]EGR1765092.1 alpha/beta hydrolase [Vibrio parahaemolyticus]EIN6341849.1 alpha/beta hydrolase [Vibrio parahaemolyticus]EIN6343269.1 alpha/beta hydrolase [Vibrio parahaemolyticus]EIO3965765.1 alpha/beta hydrolase [Vibrio parahaemolyticus]EIO3988294.1 alpha/beta hydrolase [Vibrio parahaemolyticus]
MLFMVTNRKVKNGEYSDEERANFKYDYQYAYNLGVREKDKFEKTGKRGFEAALLSELKRIKKEENTTPKIGIYIHGYNNDYQDSIDEIVDLEKELSPIVKYSPIIVGFSWPSTGKTLNYLSDREEVRDSVGAFTRFLKDINDFIIKNERDCFSTTFCIAHSMGNYLLRKGMEYLSDDLGRPIGRMLFDETVLLAPDIASTDIEIDGKGAYIAEFSRRVHIYYSKHDRALKASSAKRFGANRLGRHGADDYDNLPANVVVIDANKYANETEIKGKTDRVGDQVSVHSSHRYHSKILEDLVKVISSIDRDQIEGRKRVDKGQHELPKGNHYELI